jgi:hypothetical protein
MPGGDAIGADLAGGDEELVELEVVVAEGAGDGGAACQVLGDEGPDYLGFETVLLVDDVVGDVELLGYVAGVVDVVDAAAASLDGLGHAFVSGEAALVPELEGEADEGVALGAEKCGDGGGVDSSGHGDGDGLGLGGHDALLQFCSFYFRIFVDFGGVRPEMQWCFIGSGFEEGTESRLCRQKREPGAKALFPLMSPSQG